MSQTHADHFALFGNVRILRSWCGVCERWAFVIDNKRCCCGEEYAACRPERYKRIVEPEQKRRTPNGTEKKAILESQNYQCFYCDMQFGTYVLHHGKLKQVRLHWDHLTPFSFTQNNSSENFVASCGFCNQWKHDLVFQTVEEARTFIQTKWEAERNRL